MNFVVKKSDLLKSLNHVQSIVEKKNVLPILSNVKLEARSDSLMLTTTDMDISITESIAASVENPGVTTIPVIPLYEIIRKIPEDVEMNFAADESGGHIAIKCGTSNFTLPSISAEEFPNFDLKESSHSFQVEANVLKNLFAKTRHAICNDEARYYLGGIYLHSEERENNTILNSVAIDGHRLAKYEYEFPEKITNIPGVIVPQKTVNQILKLLDDNAGVVQVSLSEKNIIFEIGTSKVISKLIDGKYPDYNRLIPQNNDKELQTNSKSLSNAVELVISVSSDKTKTVKFNISESEIGLNASGEFNGSASGAQTIPATFNSEPISIGFNSKYLLDILNVIKGEMVKLMILNKGSAVVIFDGADDKSLFVLMPLQV